MSMRLVIVLRRKSDPLAGFAAVSVVEAFIGRAGLNRKGGDAMRRRLTSVGMLFAVLAIAVLLSVHAEENRPSSYAPVVIHEDFDKTVAKMEAAKPAIAERQAALLEMRYDMKDKPAEGVTMARGKPVQEGVRVKLPEGNRIVAGLGCDEP